MPIPLNVDNNSASRERHFNRNNRISADLSCSGSDCDMSWICLFICILALCFAIPLIYVVYIAEHHIDPEIPLSNITIHHTPE